MKPNSRKKSPPTITVGHIHDVPGTVNIAGGDIHIRNSATIHHDANAEIITEAITAALKRTKNRPRTTRAQKADIEKEVKGIESELRKKKADRGFLAERFHNIALMAPDILDVIIAGLGNPAAGIGMTMKKIAEKAKAEAIKDAARN